VSEQPAVQTKPRRAPRTPKRPFYRALKPIRTEDGGVEKHYKVGQVVPEANSWPRVEAWVRSRHLELVE
jgi:hypothetical protein